MPYYSCCILALPYYEFSFTDSVHSQLELSHMQVVAACLTSSFRFDDQAAVATTKAYDHVCAGGWEIHCKIWRDVKHPPSQFDVTVCKTQMYMTPQTYTFTIALAPT